MSNFETISLYLGATYLNNIYDPTSITFITTTKGPLNLLYYYSLTYFVSYWHDKLCRHMKTI